MNKDQELLMKIMFNKKLKEREEEPEIECCIDKIIKNKEKLKDIKPTSGFNAG